MATIRMYAGHSRTLLRMVQKRTSSMGNIYLVANVGVRHMAKNNNSNDSHENEGLGFNSQDRKPITMSFLKDTSDNAALDELSLTEDNFEMDRIQQEISRLKELKGKYQMDLKKEKKILKLMKAHISDSDNKVSENDISTISCGGCGVYLHSVNASIPGYVPRELYNILSAEKIPELLCHRCSILTKHNAIIHQEVDQTIYKDIVKQVKKERSLVVMLVDVTDITNSIVHDFIGKVGLSTPLFVVGNKIDLIPKDGKGYLQRVIHRITDECTKGSPTAVPNIVHSCLISAKTGYGIEELINKLFHHYWNVEGNVYLVGMTNSGKSTLFNIFLDSDYCKHTCRDIVQRATVSNWPGTTLGLIKFPILRPRKAYIEKRVTRLHKDRLNDVEEIKKRQKRLQTYGKSANAILFGTVGKTEFRTEEYIQELEQKMVSTGNSFSGYTPASLESVEAETAQEREALWVRRKTVLQDDYPDSKWAFDTPGLSNKHQCINYLTGPELKKVLKLQMIRPRVFVLGPGETLFVTGLGRIDYLRGSGNTLFTVHTSHMLPVHVMDTDLADNFYTEHIGTEELGIPLGGSDRLDKLASLCAREFCIETEDENVASADLQLSSLGWVSVAARQATVHIRAYTPGGRGMSVRTPALLPNIVAFKGTRVIGTKTYRMKKLKR